MKPLLAIAVLCAACPLGAQVINEKVRKEHRTFSSILVLPPEVSLDRVGMKGGEGMTADSGRVGDAVYRAVCHELTSRGAKIVPPSPPAAANDDARYAAADIQRQYATVAVQLNRRPGKVKIGRYTLGDAVAAWPPAVPADTLAFIRANGSVTTGARQAFGWAILFPRFSDLEVRIAFVDARSGDVLAFGRFHCLGNAVKKTDQDLNWYADRALDRLPLPSPPPK